MAYRYDPDLTFLSYLKSSDLDELVYCLICDKDGEKRYTEELSDSDNFKLYYPDHNKYWSEIAAEIQCFGANSIATIFRLGDGVLYKEVLCDVCDKLKVNYNSKSNVEIIENNLFLKIIEDSLEKMSESQKRDLASQFSVDKDFSNINLTNATFQYIFRRGGFESYKLAVIIANGVWKAIFGRGLPFAANWMIVKVLSMWVSPIGWAFTALWTMLDIAGPAYRVTVPAVIQVSLLRKKYLYDTPKNRIILCRYCSKKLRITGKVRGYVICPCCNREFIYDFNKN